VKGRKDSYPLKLFKGETETTLNNEMIGVWVKVLLFNFSAIFVFKDQQTKQTW